jgi:hypothetical protein
MQFSYSIVSQCPQFCSYTHRSFVLVEIILAVGLLSAMQCSLEQVYSRFGGTQNLHHQGRRVDLASSRHESIVLAACLVYRGGRFPSLTTEAGVC